MTENLENYNLNGSKYSLNLFLVGLMQLISGIFHLPIMAPSGFHTKMFISSITHKETPIHGQTIKHKRFYFNRFLVLMIYIPFLFFLLPQVDYVFTQISIGIWLGILTFLAF